MAQAKKGQSMKQKIELTETDKKKRIIAATVLIVIGIASLLFWEMWGREYVTYKYVITAAQDLKRGDVITKEMLREKPFLKESVINGSIKKENINSIIGMVVKQYIVKGEQMHKDYLTTPEKYVDKGESIFKLPATWIDMRSSSIRKGDIIEIYGQDGVSLGKFKVAFVKDAQEREITSVDDKPEDTLDRVDSTGVVDNIEIITTLELYNIIKNRASGTEEHPGEKFTIVQVI